MIIWFCGPSGSGKTTLAQETLTAYRRSVLLDGDEVRTWLTPDCDYSQEGRDKHVDRIWALADHLRAVRIHAIVSVVSPPRSPVDHLIHLVGRQVDPWPGTTYPVPKNPDLVLNTLDLDIDECYQEIVRLLRS